MSSTWRWSFQWNEIIGMVLQWPAVPEIAFWLQNGYLRNDEMHAFGEYNREFVDKLYENLLRCLFTGRLVRLQRIICISWECSLVPPGKYDWTMDGQCRKALKDWYAVWWTHSFGWKAELIVKIRIDQSKYLLSFRAKTYSIHGVQDYFSTHCTCNVHLHLIIS